MSAHETSVKVLTQGLIDLGILKGELKTLIKNESYKRFLCMVLVTGWAWMYMMWVLISITRPGENLNPEW
jgi:hypothetical protein